MSSSRNSSGTNRTQDAAEKRTVGTPVQDGDTGIGTGKEPPKDETVRTPDRTVVVGESASPLVPKDVVKQTEPAEGLAASSTNPVAASLSRPSIPGTNHARLLDGDLKEISPDDVFKVEEGATAGVAQLDVIEEFRYPNSERPMHQRLIAKGDRWPLQRIAGFKAAHPLAQAQAEQDHPSGELLRTTGR